MSELTSKHQFWREFIELYRDMPCLWKVKCKEYSDRNKKDMAYGVLIKKLREEDASANRETVTKKINSMRSAFRKELKKVRASKRSGALDVYRPALWYYDLLLFLVHQQQTREPIYQVGLHEVSVSKSSWSNWLSLEIT